MRSIIFIFFILNLLSVCYAEGVSSNRIKQAPYNSKDSIRIQNIAKMLPVKPTGFGFPISNRDEWNKVASLSRFKNVVSEAEKFLNMPYPDWSDSLYLVFSEKGTRPSGQKMMKDRLAWLPPLVWAECIENKGRFLPVIEMVLQELTQQKAWTLPAHDRSLSNFNGTEYTVDLAAASNGFEYAQALYMLGGKLNSETRKIVINSLYECIFNPVKKSLLTGQGHRWLSRTDNWNSVCIEGVCGAALAVLDDPLERAFYVRMAEKYAPNSVSGFSEDGYCSEGLGYYNYGFGRYIQLRELLWQATDGKIDLFKNEKMKRIAAYGPNIEIWNNSYPYFSDCRNETTASEWVLWYCSRNLGLGIEKYDTLDFRGPARLVEGTLKTFPNSASLSSLQTGNPLKPGIRSYFEVSGIVVSRPIPESDCNIAAAFKGGHNAENHNQNDVGAYTIVVGDQQIMGDAGGPHTYTNKTFSDVRYTLYKSLGSYGHPVPVVDGVEQVEGREAEAVVLKTDFTNDKDVFKVDFTSAYPSEKLKKLIRTFELDRTGKGQVTVTDEFKLKKKAEFETSITTRSTVTILDNNNLILERNGVRAKVEIDASAPVEITQTTIEEDAPAYTRIGIKLINKSKDGVIAIKYSPINN